jgi:hypothetical protein
MASTSLVQKIRKNPHVQFATVALLAVNVKYGKEGGSDEYGEEAGPVLEACERRMGLPEETLNNEWMTPEQQLVKDTVEDEVMELAFRMERTLVKAGLLSKRK